MTFNIEILSKCMPFAKPANILKFAEPLRLAMDKYSINTPKRMAAFLAQVAHESGSLKYVKEIASGEAYDTRVDLGNTPEKDGDGTKYKGRGLIQITGVTNYKAVGKELGFDFIKEPEKLELPGAASLSAAWFWSKKGLNELADIDAFEKITKRINGGLNGFEDRKAHWARCNSALGVTA